MIKNGFKKIKGYSFLRKISLVGFFISAMFVVYSVCNIAGILNIKDEVRQTAKVKTKDEEKKENFINDNEEKKETLLEDNQEKEEITIIEENTKTIEEKNENEQNNNSNNYKSNNNFKKKQKKHKN